VANVPATNGLFVVQLNDAGQFGANAFNGDARWLQVEVCSDASCSGSPTVLAPRQPVTPTPYSRFSAGPWQLNGGNLYFSGGNVGIGTTTPTAPLSLGSSLGNNKLLLYDDGTSNGYGFGIQDFQFRLHVDSPFARFSFLNGSAGSELLTILGNGNVGIGTPNPAVKLDVLGNIYLGAGARYSVPGAEETLKMVRGTVFSDGSPLGGCCYSVNHVSTGEYQLIFTTAFSGRPSVTVTATGLFVAGATATTNSAVTVYTALDGSLFDDSFNFIAIGPR
jgi:hypothetical protein